MKRNMMLKLLNPILAVLFVSQIMTGIFHGSLPHEVFEIMHEGGGMLLALAALLHVVLNWNWIRTTYLKRRSNSEPQTTNQTDKEKN